MICSDEKDPDTHTMEVAARSDDGRYPIYVQDASYITFDGIEVRFGTSRCMLIKAASSAHSYITVINCIIFGSGTCGIDVTESRYSGDLVRFITHAHTRGFINGFTNGETIT